MKRILSALAALLALAAIQSCTKEEIKEAQTTQSELTLPSNSGSAQINIEATGNWTAFVTGAAQRWAKIDQKEGNGNTTLNLSYKTNKGFARMCRLVIEQKSSAKTDTIFVKQYGKARNIAFDAENILFPVVADRKSVNLKTNFTNAFLTEAKVEVDYKDGNGNWIETEMDLENTALIVKSKVNDQVGQRKADIVLSYLDGWERKHEIRLPVTQIGNRAANADKVTMAELKAKISAPEGKIKIVDDITIEGIVINDHSNPNTAMNPNLSDTSIDYDVNYRTSYLETADGSEGIAVLYNTKLDNICNSRTKIELSLKDATLEKMKNPERYIIRDVASTYIVDLDTCAMETLPIKVKSIGELTDKDVFTYVTLKNCEFPVNECSYTPLNEGYTKQYNSFKVDCCPLLVRDIEGNSMYMMTNIECPYRRDGSGLPLGAGKISGVIVHDQYTRYEEDGDIGRYQIRHLSKEDIRLAQKQEEGFSNILALWDEKSANVKIDSHWNKQPTVGKGLFKHSSGSWMSGDHAYRQPGPVDGSENKGVSRNFAWASASWCPSGNAFPYWLIEFSTAEINTSVMSLQFDVLGRVGSPRFWAVEYSLDNGNSWKRITTYSCPDLAEWSNTLQTQMPGAKSIDVKLPADLCGKEKVQIRLIPTENTAGTANSYAGSGILSGKRNIITYVSVRYNK